MRPLALSVCQSVNAEPHLAQLRTLGSLDSRVAYTGLVTLLLVARFPQGRASRKEGGEQPQPVVGPPVKTV